MFGGCPVAMPHFLSPSTTVGDATDGERAERRGDGVGEDLRAEVAEGDLGEEGEVTEHISIDGTGGGLSRSGS